MLELCLKEERYLQDRYMYSIPGEEASESGNIHVFFNSAKSPGSLNLATTHHASSHHRMACRLAADTDVAWPRQQFDGDVNDRFE